MKTFFVATVAVLLFGGVVRADIYMHNPRGSNNRNCETGQDRANGQRLFDSQNNDAGGYACPRAYPFDCYNYDGQEKANCNAQNTQNENKNMVSKTFPYNVNVNQPGVTNRQTYTAMESMYYIAGSVIPLEWTAQHACGPNSKVHCDIIIQVACEDTLTDDCGTGATGNGVCKPRDGTPVNNQSPGDNLNGQATNRIPNNPADQDDYRYGRHETYRYYEKCLNRERNKGLFIADQDVNGNSADYTRQNPNGDNNGNNANGLECPEESEYYPYWHPTPWKDLAVLTSDVSKCQMYQTESQNVKAKNECLGTNPNGQNGQTPNQENSCIAAGGTWSSVPAYNLPPPACEVGPWSRDNHLGNAAGDGQASGFNWTVPEWLVGKDTCVLRLRYNISTGDFGDLSVNGNFTMNGDNSPIVDRDEREIQSYKDVLGHKLGFAINSNQYGRTFQDRSYTFQVKPRNDETAGACSSSGEILNLNVRGKRGNIVQVYPNVEYDFVPSKSVITTNDCLHIQWTGSDYNPNRNPNNAEGGPPDVNNDNQARADRTNLVQMSFERDNYPDFDSSNYKMFDADAKTWERLAYLDQPINNNNKCDTPQQLQNRANNREQREREPTNCMKLNGQRSPYFNAGVVKAGQKGSYAFMSTRNNNFSNRGQKGQLIIEAGSFSGAGIAGIVIGSIAGVGLAGAAVVMGMKHFSASGNSSSYLPTSSPAQAPTSLAVGGGASNGSNRVVALYDHDAKEPGELNFKKGETITVTNKDKSGWWTGRKANGETGIFPANYVKA